MNKEVIIIILIVVLLYLYFSKSEKKIIMVGQESRWKQRKNKSPVKFTSEWFSSIREETVEEYLRRKYPTIEEIWKLEDVRSRECSFWDDKKLIWDCLLHLSSAVYLLFPLINIDDLTQLVQQIDENNWKEPQRMKKFGMISGYSSIEKDISFLQKKRNLSFIFLYNLANQILVRCIIVANRLTHGVDKESEENIMKLGLGFQKCYRLPEPKAINENNKQLLEQKVQMALNGDKNLLSRLQDLPYLNPKCKLT